MSSIGFRKVLLHSLLAGLSLFVSEVNGFAQPADGHDMKKAEAESEAELWTCAMHPQIKLKKPGQCPICNMDLVPVDTHGSVEGQTAELRLSDRAKKLIEVETSVVERKWVERRVRLVGRIDYDETRVKHITSWAAGRIDRLYVDYTGVRVTEGDHMVYLYSPELLSAQEELIQASRAFKRLGSGASALVKRSTRRSVQAVREKLRLLGLTEKQVKELEKRGRASDHVTIYAPMGGVVVEKNVNQGMYVQTGTKIYTIADLSHLWIYLDAYESDLPWLSYGQVVDFTAEAFPGEKFSGVISFIQPFLDRKTRTVKVRVNVENQHGKLKPGLFVTASVKAEISAQGKVLGRSFSGQFVCPMHPEIIRGEEGDCPICGMSLAQAETLPFISAVQKDNAQPPLVIPASAPLITGRRAVVYVEKAEGGGYQGREVVLGPRADDYYVVKEGLQEGEVVVSNGAFKIDADLQIQGTQSMMNPQGGSSMSGHSH